MDGQLPMADFCAAALRLLAVPAAQVTGHVAYSEDVLHPELGLARLAGTGLSSPITDSHPPCWPRYDPASAHVAGIHLTYY